MTLSLSQNSDPANEKKLLGFDMPLTQSDAVTLLDHQDKWAWTLSSLYTKLIAFLNESTGKQTVAIPQSDTSICTDKLTVVSDMVEVKRSFKSGTFNETRLKFTGQDGKELKSLLANNAVVRCAITSNSTGTVAIAEGDAVSIVDISKILEVGSTLDKGTYETISQTSVGFEVVSLAFNPAYDHYILVCGLRECRVLTINKKLEIVDQLDVALSLDALGQGVYIQKAFWIPGSMVKIGIVSNKVIKIYDLAKDKISPVYYLTLLEGSISDAVLIPTIPHPTIVALSSRGILYTQPLDNIDGPFIMAQTLFIEDAWKDTGHGTLHYSPFLNLLIVSFLDGETYLLRMDITKLIVVQKWTLRIPGTLSGATDSQTLSCSCLLEPTSSTKTLVCYSPKVLPSSIVCVDLQSNQTCFQALKPSSSKATRVEGFALCAQSIIAIFDDGSLSRYAFVKLTESKDKQPIAKKPDLVSKKVTEPLPITFFEKATNVTSVPTITLAGDVLQQYTSDVAKQRLASNDDYLVSPNVASFKIVVRNANPELVMVGLRVLLGNNSSSLQHMPKQIKIFERVIEVTEGAKRWHVLSLHEEALQADKEFTFTLSSAKDNEPVIDSMEVYAKTKDDFGWEEREQEETILETSSEVYIVEKILYHVLKTIRVGIRTDPTTASKLKQELLPLLTHRPSSAQLLSAAKDLLQAVFHNHNDYCQFKDSSLLYYAQSCMLDKASSGSTNFARVITLVQKTVSKRPKSFMNFLRNNDKFIPTLLEQFWVTLEQTLDMVVQEQIVLGMVEIICLTGVQTNESAQLALSVIEPLLFHTKQHIRHLTAKKLCGMLVVIENATKLCMPIAAKPEAPSDVEFYCDKCKTLIKKSRWSCDSCKEYDLCDNCHNENEFPGSTHTKSHPMTEKNIARTNQALGIDFTSILPTNDALYLDEDLMTQGVSLSLGIPPTQSAIQIELSKLFQILLNYCASRYKASYQQSGNRSLAFMQVLYSVVHCGFNSATLQSYFLTQLLPQIFTNLKLITLERGPQLENQILSMILLAVFLHQKHFAPREAISNYLLQNGFMELSYSILDALSHKLAKRITGSSSGNSIGALLSPQQDLNNEKTFMPYFSESYAKQHQLDLFECSYELLAESVLQVTLGLDTTDAHHTTKWQNLLCTYFMQEQALFIRGYIKKLLLRIGKGKIGYHGIRDRFIFQTNYHTLQTLSTTAESIKHMNYQDSLRLLGLLSTIAAVATQRPNNWQQFCVEESAIPLLYDISFHLGLNKEAIILVIKLLCLCFDQADQDDKGIRLEVPSLDLGKIASTLLSDSRLSIFIDLFLLSLNSAEIRMYSQKFLVGLYTRATSLQQNVLFSILSTKFGRLPKVGKNGAEFMDLLSFIINKATEDNGTATGELVMMIKETLHAQNEVLSNHPNSHIYNSLANLVEFDGYYLESEPCLVCNDPEVPYYQAKLETFTAQTKFTDSTQIIKLSGSFMIQQVTVTISNDSKKAKMLRTLNLYCNNKPVNDVGELKNKWNAWKKIKSVDLVPEQTELRIEFPLPVVACNLLLEYSSFYENMATLERLQCPRCNRVVTEKHGICSKCRENAYQCKQCRNINYENPQAYLCNECGYCRWSRFDYSLNVKPSLAAERIETEEDKMKALTSIDTESENAYAKYQQLHSLRKPLTKVLASISQHTEANPADAHSLGSTSKVNKKIALAASIYEKECKTSFESLTKSIQILLGTRRELLRYNNEKSKIQFSTSGQLESKNKCYGCASFFVSQCLTLLEKLCKSKNLRRTLMATSKELVLELMTNNLHQGSEQIRSDTRKVICALIKDNRDATDMVNSHLQSRMEYALQNFRTIDVGSFIGNEMQLVTEFMSMDDSLWETRLKLVLHLFFLTIELQGANNSVLCEHLLLPCLNIVTDLVKLSNKTRSDELSTVSYESWSREQANFQDWKRRYEATFIVSESTPSQTARQRYLEAKYASKWKQYLNQQARKRAMHTDVLMQPGWLKKLIGASSQTVRASTVAMLNSLCSSSVSRLFHFLDLVTNELLAEMVPRGENSAEFFSLFRKLIEPTEHKLYLTVKGFLPNLCSLITSEIASIRALEGSFTVTDLSQGYVLKALVDILATFLDIPTIRLKFKRSKLLEHLLDGFLYLRGLVLQKTKLIDDSCKQLSSLLDKLHTETEEDNKAYIVACSDALAKHLDDQTPTFILEQLCHIICPVKPEPVYQLILKKSSTQEDFIRGSMTNNPYSSQDVGALMRDVKNKICTTLDLHALVEDDNSMELLVSNKIIKLDLSIKQVYEQVWKRSLQTQGISDTNVPMVVVYRLQGLDGEATEEMVDSLQDDSEEQKDPEEVYKISEVLGDCGGLASLIRLISSSNFETDIALVQLALKLLYHCAKIKRNRQTLVSIGAVNALLPKLKLAVAESHTDLSELLLLTIESLVHHANTTKQLGFESNMRENVEDSKQQMKMLLDKLSLLKGKQKIVKTVSRVLPYLTYGEAQVIDLLITYFLPFLQFDKYDSNPKDETQILHLECFTNVCESIGVDKNGALLKGAIIANGITVILTDYLVDNFPVDQDQSSPMYVLAAIVVLMDLSWQSSLTKPSLPFVLRQLAGLSRGHHDTQKIITEKQLLPLIHKLEKTTTVKMIGNWAENLMEALREPESEGKSFKDAVDTIRTETRMKYLEQAEKYRQKILKEMHLSTGSGKVTADIIPDVIEELDEETGLKCMVCMEGYLLRPNDVLGVYTYSKRVTLSMDTKQRQEFGFTTVTHFNVIHFSCHKEATKAERLLKPPKEEWEGATIRNQHTRCNNIFPILGEKVSVDTYNYSLEKYWSNLYNLGKADTSRIRVLVHDLKYLLLYYAREESLSVHSQGGGRESNIKMIPFFVQMGCYLLDQKGNPQRKTFEKLLSQFLLQPQDQWLTSAVQPENPYFMTMLALFLQSLEEWKASKPQFLVRLLTTVYTEHSSKLKDLDEPSLFALCRPLLLFLCLVDKFQFAFKKSLPQADWVNSIHNALTKDYMQLIESMTQILASYEQEWLLVETFQEFFDELGLLSTALAEAKDVLQYVNSIFSSFTKK